MPAEWRYAALLLAGTAFFGLFYLGRLPGAGTLFPPPWDKLAHFVVYGGLAVCLLIAMGNRYAWLAALACMATGALDEWHQFYLPGRHADLADFLTDVMAAGIAVPVASLALRRCVLPRAQLELPRNP